MSVKLDWKSAPFVQCGKSWKQVLTVANVVARNANEATAEPMVENDGVCFLPKSGDKRSVLCWCIWQESGFSRREDVFTSNLLYKEVLYMFYLQCDLQR
jgi:hypothetical protein